MTANQGSMISASHRAFKAYQPDQLLLLPPSLREWLPEGHLAYFLDDVVDEMDLSEIWKAYEGDGRAHPAYWPPMMVKVLLYGYCIGVFSSRMISRRLHEDVAFRVLAANNAPDFRTIANFRRRHLKALEGLFGQVLVLCRKAGLVRLGHVALDGTKIDANASKHKAMSYERMVESGARIEQEVAALLERAEEIDTAEDAKYGEADGSEIPEELKRRETRLAKIREAKAALEAEQKAKRAAAEQAEQAEQAARQADEGDAAKPKRGGRKKKPVSETPEPKAQRNFTDPDSRIMKNSDKAFRQAYNAQAAVDSAYQIIVAAAVTQEPNDKLQVIPMVTAIEQNLGCLPANLSADTGYCSEANLEFLDGRPVRAFIATEKDRHDHGEPKRTIDPGEKPRTAAMQERIATPEGRAEYRQRKQTVEPVFGQIKGARGFRRFLLRGLQRVQAEWSLVCSCHNLLKLWRSTLRTA